MSIVTSTVVDCDLRAPLLVCGLPLEVALLLRGGRLFVDLCSRIRPHDYFGRTYSTVYQLETQ